MHPDYFPNYRAPYLGALPYPYVAGDYRYASLAPYGLGFDPVTVAAAIQTSNSLLSMFKNNAKERERLQKNMDAYKLATNGRQDAMEYLKYRSGRYGTASSIGPSWEGGGPVGGWATQTARDDAWRLYQNALGMFGIGIDPSTGVQTPGSGYVPNASDPGHATDAGLPGVNVQSLPGVTVTGRMDYMPLVIAGAAILLLSRRR